MENGYEIVWTDFALEDLENTVKYLEEQFSDKEVGRLADEIERILLLISTNPNIFALSDEKQVRKAIILKFNSMYYRIVKNEIQILAFFSNRHSSKNLK